MPARQLLTAAIEQSLNAFLTTQAFIQPQLNALQGKRLVVFLDVLDRGVTLVFADKVLVINGPESFEEAKSEIDAASCIVNTKLSVLSKLADTSQLTTLIQQGHLELVGDITIAQRASELAATNRLDFEEALATYTSDVFAHTLFKIAAEVHSKAKRALDTLLIQAADLAIEERPIAARRQAVEGIEQQIEQLRDDADRVSLKFKQLETKLKRKVSQCD